MPNLRVSDLKERLRGRGWQPARAEVTGLFAMLGEAERDDAELIERALARLGPALVDEIERRLADAKPPLRARLVRLLGRVAEPGRLMRFVDDEDAKTRRNAVVALGRLSASDEERAAIEAALVAAWAREPTVEMRRSLAATLGKIGGEAALRLLEGERADDAELARLLDEARLKLRRTLGRVGAGRGRVAGERTPPEGTVVVLRCREGLAELTAASVARLAAARDVRVLDGERVALRLEGPDASLSALWGCRTFLRCEFPIDVKSTPVGDLPPEGAAVVAALTAPSTRALLAALTDGRPRWRLEWEGAGHRRGLTFRVVREVAARAPELENDPTDSLWEVVARPDGTVAVWPRGLEDPRFAWRAAQVPASSHPTIAAALVEAAGVRVDDIVWDPFCGAGSELVERALAGPYRALVGSDLDERALAATRINLERAGVVDARIERADATAWTPPLPPTVVLTNPPMGRRVLDRHRTGALFEAFLANAARVLAPGGRIAWLVPRGDEVVRAAAALGFAATMRRRVDMAGFWAELQLLSIENRAAASASSRRPPRPARPPAPGRPSRGGRSRPGRR